MVATRMLAIPLADAKRWESLGVFFEYLRDAKRDYKAEHTFALGPWPSVPEVAPSLLSCVAHHLIHATKPVAIVGQAGFDNLIDALWRKLPPELRQMLGFGFSFTPTDLTVSRAHVVAVPDSCQARWRDYQFQCHSSWDQPLSVPTAALLSDASAREFLVFLSEVGLVFSSFLDYGRYARLWDQWQRRSQNDAQVVYGLLRSLGTLIPDPDQATEQKMEAMLLAARWLISAGADAILAQRSVKATSFPENAGVLGRAITEWVKACFGLASGATETAVAEVISAVPTAQSATWQAWVREGLRQALVPLGNDAASVAWAVLSQADAFAEAAAQLPADAATQKTLIQTFTGTLPSGIYPLVEKLCGDRNWISLLATLANARLGFRKAMQLVLSHNVSVARNAAVKMLCGTARPSEVWAVAFEHDDATLLDCAVLAALAQPSLWTDAAPDLNRWASLLEGAATLEPEFLRKADADPIVARLFEAWEHGAPVRAGILEALEKTGRLEFSAYSKREHLWSVVPSRFLSRARANTLREWLRRFYSQPPADPTLENELVQILFAPVHLDAAFPQNSAELGRRGLLLLETWGHENACQAWLNALVASSRAISGELAGRAGSLVSRHQWRTAARLAKHYDEAFNRHDLAPIWRAYYESLGTLEKFAFDWLTSSWKASFAPHPTNHLASMIDAVFITALPEEFSAVRAHLSERHEQLEQGTLYEIGRFQNEEVDCIVAVVQTGMGNPSSAAATERALTFFKPSFAFFVGIAGGLRDDLRIGDVVAADKVYGYEYGKAAATHQPRPEATSVYHEAVQRAYAVVRDDLWQRRISPAPVNKPVAMVKPIAAGEKVLVSEAAEDLRRLRAIYTDAHAVAMEEHGFAVAMRGHPRVCFAVVRGISDLIENKGHADKAGSHIVAARHAAAFAFEMLSGLVRARRQSRGGEPPIID
jgi:nucleoside phosphorylase